MATIDREKVEARLRERAEEIARRRANMANSSDGMREGELADYDQHPADQERLAEGSYGTCVDCGNDIPEARLEAIPEAIRCIDDQNRYEAQLRARGGPPAGP